MLRFWCVCVFLVWLLGAAASVVEVAESSFLIYHREKLIKNIHIQICVFRWQHILEAKTNGIS